MFYLHICEKGKHKDYDGNNPDLKDKPCNSPTVFLAYKFFFIYMKSIIDIHTSLIAGIMHKTF